MSCTDASARARTLIAVATADAGPDLQKQVSALQHTVRILCHQHQAAINLMLPPNTKGTEHEVPCHLPDIAEPLIAHVAIECDIDAQDRVYTVKVNSVYLRVVNVFSLLTQSVIDEISEQALHAIKRRHRPFVSVVKGRDLEVTA